MLETERVQALNARDVRAGKYVLYWMQASQRAEWNHALEEAVRKANDLGQPLVVVFGITDNYPEANLRHYAFMIEGLHEVESALRQRGIQLIVRHGSPDRIVTDMAKDASIVVTDRGYLRVQCMWREHVARHVPCAIMQVESDVIVPVETASQKENYSAATLRPRIHRHLSGFIKPVRKARLKHDSLGLRFDGLDLSNVQAVLNSLKVDRSVMPVEQFHGGTTRAKRLLRAFIQHRFKDYAVRRNEPSLDIQSHMSPYLHFGQISPLYIAMKVQEAAGVPEASKESFLEELIVRRELSMNMVYYNWDYDVYEKVVPAWAQASLDLHRSDKREYIYTRDELERADTHDPFWNAAQEEMLFSGKMHNYMRMYWGKKIIEWSKTPKEAFQTALYLNNKYELDGRDPNSYAGVAWCFGKHDRAWPERPIFGKVRYMNAAGLRRKFDMEAYLRKVDALKSNVPSSRKG